MEVQQGEIEPKQKQNPTRQIQNAAPPCQASRNHKIMWAWLAWLALLFQLCHLQHSDLCLRQLHCLPAVFGDRHPMAMAFPTSTDVPSTASRTRFSVPLCPDFFYHTISVLRGSPEPWLKTLTPQSCVFCAYKNHYNADDTFKFWGQLKTACIPWTTIISASVLSPWGDTFSDSCSWEPRLT